MLTYVLMLCSLCLVTVLPGVVHFLYLPLLSALMQAVPFWCDRNTLFS